MGLTLLRGTGSSCAGQKFGNLTVKELLPIVIVCGIWGHTWRGSSIECRCDNAMIVTIVCSGSSCHLCSMHLDRCLFFLTSTYQLYLHPVHLPDKLNAADDQLSRDDVPGFCCTFPQAKARPTPIPPPLCRALVMQTPDWTSVSWRDALRSTLA